MYEEKKITAKEAAEECGISEEEFLQKAEEYEKKAQKEEKKRKNQTVEKEEGHKPV